MMSKQAWRFVLKRNKHKRKRGERERERTKRREEKVRGTAQESFSHEAQKNKNNASHHIYSKDNRGDGQPPLLSQRTKNKTIIHRFKEVTPPGHMAETPTCTNCILGTQRDPSRASPLWETWRMDGMTGRGC